MVKIKIKIIYKNDTDYFFQKKILTFLYRKTDLMILKEMLS